MFERTVESFAARPDPRRFRGIRFSLGVHVVALRHGLNGGQ